MAAPKYLFLHLVSIQILFILTGALPGPAPALAPRADAFFRGWPLSEPDSCPDSTFRCGKAQCCPNAAYCYTTTDLLSNICCPSGGDNGDEDCAYDIALDSRCANTSWVLWTSNHNPICCLSGQLAVQPASTQYYGSCVPGTSSVPAASLATKIGSGPTVTAPLPSTFVATAAAPTLPL